MVALKLIFRALTEGGKGEDYERSSAGANFLRLKSEWGAPRHTDKKPGIKKVKYYSLSYMTSLNYHVAERSSSINPNFKCSSKRKRRPWADHERILFMGSFGRQLWSSNLTIKQIIHAAVRWSHFCPCNSTFGCSGALDVNVVACSVFAVLSAATLLQFSRSFELFLTLLPHQLENMFDCSV